MTSPQAAALDVAPADATTSNDLHSTIDGMDLTAEAQGQATMPIEEGNTSQHEHLNGSNQQQTFDGPADQDRNNSASQNEVQIPPQQGATTHGADAAIPDDKDLQNNSLSLNASSDLIYALTSMRGDTMYNPAYFPFTADQMNEMELEMSLGQPPIQPFPDLDPEPLEEQQIQAYAKLDFEDGSVYMNTYSIFIGRDRKAAKKVLRREKAVEKALESGRQQNEHRQKPPHSESCGIVAHEEDYGSTGKPKSKKAKSKKSKASKHSHSSHSSQKIAKEESPDYELGVYPVQYDGSDTEAAPVDPMTLRPNPDSCPTVGIHPRSNTFKAYKAISRRHVKIAFNTETSVFELHVIGNNGCFIEGPGRVLDNSSMLAIVGSKHVLVSGTQIQIGEVAFTFVLPNDDPDGACETIKDTFYYEDDARSKSSIYRDGRGKEMSTDHSQPIRSDAGNFSDDSEDNARPRTSDQLNGHGGIIENGHDTGESEDGDEDEEDEGNMEEEQESQDESEDEGQEEDEQTQTEMLRPSIEEDNSPGTANTKERKPSLSGRKGPGRPPKNGVMSKRAEKELKKQAEEAAAAEKTGADSSEPKRGKVGRPRKHPLPDPETANKPKRKYTKRKPKEPQDGVPEGTGSGDGAATATKVKKEKPFKPARSPTPVFKEEELTPEQLAKPSENYVVIIYNAMLASPHKEMGLPQIYNAIKRAYPFFALKTETKGWESSVRHNLSGNPEVFEKGVKDGKGHMWSLKPGATVDKEKKKKAVVDPQYQGHPQNIQQAPHNPHGQYPGMSYPYANYHLHPNPNYPMGQPQYMPHPGPYPPQPPPPPPGYPPQQNGFQQPPGPWPPHPPNYSVPSIPPALIAPSTSGSYSSPYAPKPAESSVPPSNNQPHASPYGPPPPSDQRPPPQPSPPTTVPQASPPQYQTQAQSPHPPNVPAPPAQMQYAPPPLQQHPAPGNPHQPGPLYFPQTQTQSIPQSKPPTPPIQQPHVVQHPPAVQQPLAVQQPPVAQQPAAIRQSSPPQPSVESQKAPQPIPKTTPEAKARVEKMLGEFQRMLMGTNIAKEDIIKASIELVRRDGDKAVPDPDSSDKSSMKLIIETLRGSLASIEGSGFTKPESDFQRSFQPTPTPSTPFQASAPVNGSSTPVNKPHSTIPRPPLSVARPPMHTGIRRNDSGSPAIPGSNSRPASVSGGRRASTPAAAGNPTPPNSGNANSPNGASAATSIPVPVSEAIPKMQVPAVSTPVSRPADADVTMIVGELDNGFIVTGQPQQIVGQKRSRDEVDGSAMDEQENVKRVAV